MINGDKMDRTSPRSVFKEIRLNLEPTSQGSTVAIRLPSHGFSALPSRATQKRSNIVEIPVAEDEETFRQRHLSTASSVYHRVHNSSPRSFLWRVLEKGKVLSIQPVDISKPNKKALDANLTLRLTFPNPIAPSCIAFSDPKGHDFLSVHVLTQSNHLYTLNLRPDLFRKTSSTDEGTSDWCRSYLSSAFSFKHPHRLVALNAEELLVSLIDGGLLRLTRPPGGDGSVWKEVFYNEGGWSYSLRSLIPFQGNNTIPHGKLNIELSAVISMASQITNMDNMPYVYTVSVDHRLRVWNLRTGKLAYMKDMLTGELDLSDTKKQVIDPSLSQLIKVFGQDENLLCVTFSPLENGQFKFWRPHKLNDSSIEMEDMFPMVTLEPQAPTSELWTLADFSVTEGESLTFSIWTLWKNNTTYRVHALEFTVGDSADAVRRAWSKKWTAVATETLKETPHPTSAPGDSLDISDKWLEYLLAPGRYTAPTIETGLCIWENNSGPSSDAARKPASLPERMCSSIASFNTLGRAADGKMDYAQLRTAAEQQWLRFYRLLEELDKQRGEAQSLAVDPHGDMPCVVLADGIAAIRECSPLEEIWHNPNLRTRETIHIAAPIVAASEFRDTFSAPFLQSCRSMLLSEISEEPLLTVPARMRAFYDKCGFADQVDDEAYAQLGDRLKEFGDGFHDLTPEVYQALFDLMVTEQTLRAGDLLLGNFGTKVVVRGVQEIVELHRNVCLDQILLLILLEAEVIHSEDGTPFETAKIYQKFLQMLQKLELVDWLVRTQISSPLDTRERSSSISEQSLRKDGPSHETVSVLGGIFRSLFSLPNDSMPRAMTQTILDICSPLSTYEAFPAATQCFLLGKGRPDLAMDFNRFTEPDPFSVYVQGRVCLASQDPQAASVLFKKAAFGLSYSDPNKRTDYRSAGYISEIERNLLNAGIPSYYSHIVALYEEEKYYSFVVDFSRLALQFIKPGSKDDEESRLRTEMHSRLFNAAIETFRYDAAYSVLALFTNHILQISSLKKLVAHMCDNCYASQLIAFPFIGLQDEVDEILAHKCLSIVDVKAGIPYHKILYAWRIKRSNFRGAASISLERLHKLILSGEGDKPIDEDSLETHVTKQYVTLINALSCVDPKQAWILHEEQPQKGASWNGKEPKRKVVTLEDIRREYQAELDRVAAIENNQFAFGDEMDVL